MKANIVLTGFMATGKTAVGKHLAEKFKKKFSKAWIAEAENLLGGAFF